MEEDTTTNIQVLPCPKNDGEVWVAYIKGKQFKREQLGGINLCEFEKNTKLVLEMCLLKLSSS